MFFPQLFNYAIVKETCQDMRSFLKEPDWKNHGDKETADPGNEQ